MATARKVLGQAYPSSGALTGLYTVPGATQTIVTSVTCCNQGSVAAKVRISVAIAGAADTAAQYVYYDVTVDPYDTFTATIEATLGAADVVRCQSNTGTVSFNAFGTELS